MNTSFSWFLFPHWYARRSRVNSCHHLAVQVTVSLCFSLVYFHLFFLKFLMGGNRFPCAFSLILSLRIVAGHIVEFHRPAITMLETSMR